MVWWWWWSFMSPPHYHYHHHCTVVPHGHRCVLFCSVCLPTSTSVLCVFNCLPTVVCVCMFSAAAFPHPPPASALMSCCYPSYWWALLFHWVSVYVFRVFLSDLVVFMSLLNWWWKWRPILSFLLFYFFSIGDAMSITASSSVAAADAAAASEMMVHSNGNVCPCCNTAHSLSILTPQWAIAVDTHTKDVPASFFFKVCVATPLMMLLIIGVACLLVLLRLVNVFVTAAAAKEVVRRAQRTAAAEVAFWVASRMSCWEESEREREDCSAHFLSISTTTTTIIIITTGSMTLECSCSEAQLSACALPFKGSSCTVERVLLLLLQLIERSERVGRCTTAVQKKKNCTAEVCSVFVLAASSDVYVVMLKAVPGAFWEGGNDSKYSDEWVILCRSVCTVVISSRLSVCLCGEWWVPIG